MSERLTLLNGALAVSAGINRFDTPHHVAAALRPGVKVVVLLSGRMQIGLDGGMVQDVCGSPPRPGRTHPAPCRHRGRSASGR